MDWPGAIWVVIWNPLTNYGHKDRKSDIKSVDALPLRNVKPEISRRGTNQITL